MRIFRYLLLLSAAAVIISACDYQAGGLFYSIEQESEIINGTLEDNISVFAMARSTNYHFIAAGELMYRKADAAETVKWIADYPDGAGEYLCRSIVINGSDLYAVFYNTGATDYMTVRADVSAFEANPSGGLSWGSELDFTDPDIEGKTVIDLAAAGGMIFMLTREDTNIYSLYSAPSAGFGASSPDVEEIASELTSISELKADYDAAGAEYWIIAGNKLFTGDGTALGTNSNETALVEAASDDIKGNGFGGVLCAETDSTAAGTEVYLTTEEGVMLIRSAGSWSTISNQYDEDTGLFQPLYGLSHFSDGDQIDVILAASESGYYEMDLNDAVDSRTFVSPELTDTNLTEYIQYSSIDLSESIVLDFFVDSDRVYALGYNAGLWKNSLKDDVRFWDIE